MKGRIIFLLEEKSMKALLDSFLPRVFSGWMEGQHFLCVPHEGKTDLEKSFPRKLKAWSIPNDRFVIVRDNDAGDCKLLKNRFMNLAKSNGRSDSLVRIIFQELESWYFGDLIALAAAFDKPSINSQPNRKRFSDPDRLIKPSNEIKRLLPTFQKLGGARNLAEHLNINENTSCSFNAFFSGVARLAIEMGYKAKTLDH